MTIQFLLTKSAHALTVIYIDVFILFLQALYRPAPFDDEPEAVETRAKCDYSIKITKELALSGKGKYDWDIFKEFIVSNIFLLL